MGVGFCSYPKTEKEEFAAVTALQYFQPYLDGKEFKLFTDNQALTCLLQMS